MNERNSFRVRDIATVEQRESPRRSVIRVDAGSASVSSRALETNDPRCNEDDTHARKIVFFEGSTTTHTVAHTGTYVSRARFVSPRTSLGARTSPIERPRTPRGSRKTRRASCAWRAARRQPRQSRGPRPRQIRRSRATRGRLSRRARARRAPPRGRTRAHAATWFGPRGSARARTRTRRSCRETTTTRASPRLARNHTPRRPSLSCSTTCTSPRDATTRAKRSRRRSSARRFSSRSWCASAWRSRARARTTPRLTPRLSKERRPGEPSNAAALFRRAVSAPPRRARRGTRSRLFATCCRSNMSRRFRRVKYLGERSERHLPSVWFRAPRALRAFRAARLRRADAAGVRRGGGVSQRARCGGPHVPLLRRGVLASRRAERPGEGEVENGRVTADARGDERARRRRRALPESRRAASHVQRALRVCGDVIDKACALDWPRSRLLIQVLDDSTCLETRAVVDDKVFEWRERGVNVVARRRKNRAGYKAGAMVDAEDDLRGRRDGRFGGRFYSRTGPKGPTPCVRDVEPISTNPPVTESSISKKNQDESVDERHDDENENENAGLDSGYEYAFIFDADFEPAPISLRRVATVLDRQPGGGVRAGALDVRQRLGVPAHARAGDFSELPYSVRAVRATRRRGFLQLQRNRRRVASHVRGRRRRVDAANDRGGHGP